MDVKLARQLYELASHYHEGWLTDYEKEIAQKLGGIPDLEQARRQYQLVMIMQAAKEERDASPKKYKKRWVGHYKRFADMYNRQKAIGMTEETDALLCEWALSHTIPVDVVMMTSHHSRQWINKHVKSNNELYFGKKVLVNS